MVDGKGLVDLVVVVAVVVAVAAVVVVAAAAVEDVMVAAMGLKSSDGFVTEEGPC